MAYSLTWLAEVLEDAGLKVAEQPGWRTRGRSEVGPIRGVMCHHTGTAQPGVMPTLRVLTEGRSDLAGPLAQLGLGRDGTFFVIAAGRANHAGEGRWRGLTGGNANFIGIEAENSGSAPWPPVQVDAYARGVAALLRRIGADATMCCGHREYALPAGRKPDPSFDMDEFRRMVRDFLDGTAQGRPLIPSVDPKGRPTLRRGARGDLVIQIQTKLTIIADGVFGPMTEAAVRTFQLAKVEDSVPDGIVGPKTWRALDQIPDN